MILHCRRPLGLQRACACMEILGLRGARSQELQVMPRKYIASSDAILFPKMWSNNPYMWTIWDFWSLIHEEIANDYAYREVQLKSPNWLYGQPRLEDDDSAKPVAKTRLAEGQATEGKNEQEFGDLDWLTSLSPHAEEELFTRYLCFFLKVLSVLECC